MTIKTSLNLSQTVQNHRLSLWVLLLLLTAIILFFPIQLCYEYHALESIYAFGKNLSLFGVIYYIWLSILLLLLFAKGKNSEWQRLALVCIFALGFFGIWIINTPYGSHPDVPWNMAHVKYLQDMKTIAFHHPVLGYFQFPGIHLIAVSLSRICGLEIFTTVTVFLLFSGVLFAALLYLLFVKLLKNPFLASLAVLLMLQTLVAKQQAFWPGNLGLLLFIALLVLLAQHVGKTQGKIPDTIMMIILLMAFIISYLPLPVYLLSILGGVYLLQRVARKSAVSLSLIVLALTIFLAWEIYLSTQFFSSLVGLAPTIADSLLNPREKLAVISGSSTGYTGEAIPLWAILTRYFWLFLLFGVGAILEIRGLVKAKRLDPIVVLETGGLLGITLFAIITLIVFREAHWARFLVLAPLFTIPIILRFFSGLSTTDRLLLANAPPENPVRSSKSKSYRQNLVSLEEWFKQHVFTLLIIAFFALSLPTFLATHESVSTLSVHSYEDAGGEFAEEAYGDKNINFFSTTTTATINTYYVTEAIFHTVAVFENANSEDGLLSNMASLVYNFQSCDGNAIFMLSERFLPPSQSQTVNNDTSIRWAELVDQLAENNKNYDNGHIEIYNHLVN